MWGPCLYVTRGYIGFRLIKNLTPSAPEWTLESFPREEKSTGPLVYCADLQEKKEKIYSTSPFGYFPQVAFTHFPTRSIFVACPCSMSMGLRCLSVRSLQASYVLVESDSGTDEHDNSKGQHRNQVIQCSFSIFPNPPSMNITQGIYRCRYTFNVQLSFCTPTTVIFLEYS